MKLTSDQIDVLKMKYEDHTEDLRFRTDLDFKLLSGFVTLDLVLAAWLSQHAPESWAYAIGFLIVALGLGFAAAMIFIRNTIRRNVVIAILHNVNEALEFTKTGAYLQNQCINPESNKRVTHWLAYHLTIVIVLTAALVLMVVTGM